MTDFDDILKKAKKSVGGTPSDPDTAWKEAIGGVIYSLNYLNDLYLDPEQHFIQSIERVRCHKCNRVTYLLNVYDLANKTSSLKFHSSNWTPLSSNTYECDKCHKP
jgi:hypothetical protein